MSSSNMLPWSPIFFTLWLDWTSIYMFKHIAIISDMFGAKMSYFQVFINFVEFRHHLWYFCRTGENFHLHVQKYRHYLRYVWAKNAKRVERTFICMFKNIAIISDMFGQKMPYFEMFRKCLGFRHYLRYVHWEMSIGPRVRNNTTAPVIMIYQK